MVVSTVGGVQRVLATYGKQSFYAERAAKIKMPKTVQLGVEDKITFSPEAVSRRAAAKAPPPALPNIKDITYEDPRIKARKEEQEKGSADRVEGAIARRAGDPVRAARTAAAT